MTDLKEEIISAIEVELKRQTDDEVFLCDYVNGDRSFHSDRHIDLRKLADAIINGPKPEKILKELAALKIPRLKAGTHIADIQHNAIALHELTGATVSFEFNGSKIIVDGTKSYAQLTQEFYDGNNKRETAQKGD